MKTVQITCWCKRLVTISNNQIEAHTQPDGSPCPRGSQRYVPQRFGSPGTPSLELIDAKPMDDIPCPACGEKGHVLGAVYRQTGNPIFN